MSDVTIVDDTTAQRVVAADAAWDVLLGVLVLLSVPPGGAALLGLPGGRPWPVTVALGVLGVGSIGYGVALARAARRRSTARAICPPTAVANGLGAAALVALLVALRGDLTATGTTVVALAAAGCAGFAGAEAAHVCTRSSPDGPRQ